MQSLSAEEAGRFLAAARETRFEALWTVLLTAGLRPCEALALKWGDILEDRVQIRRSLTWVPGEGPQFAEPKTLGGRRVVSLPTSTLKALRAQRSRQAAERLAAGPSWKENDLVFANRLGGPLEWRIVAGRYFRPVLRAGGLRDIRPYDLRHTCASLLLAAGENVKVVSERLGHATATMTLDVYAHVLPDMQQKAAERLEAMLFTKAGSSGAD
jgi:integrase